METIEINNFTDLPFGENIHQQAAIAKLENGLDYEILNEDRTLEYIDYLNLTSVVEILAEFFDVESVAIAKESLLCAVALGSSAVNAYEKAIDCDPISIYGGTVGFSKTVTLEVAKQISAMKIRNIIAPKYEKGALDYLSKDENLNIIKINSPLQELLGFSEKDIKITPFGALVQEQNQSKLTKSSFKVVTKAKPSQEQAEDAVFAWKVSKHLKSKSSVVAKSLTTKAIIQGKTNGVVTTELAMDYSCESSKDAVLAIDGTIDNIETLNAALQGRIGLIIESGDGANSDKIVKLADKYNLSMIFTKIRNNKY